MSYASIIIYVIVVNGNRGAFRQFKCDARRTEENERNRRREIVQPGTRSGARIGQRDGLLCRR